ncbi:transcriptional regulator [Mycobacteroides abscessus subsp. bolletii]|nr:transcriptional regulator [Mycobacteroides abscessus subsp. bolletii]SLF40653.1 transcriptional regulator [Mycobacteroides abscessus subsp. bolletii]
MPPSPRRPRAASRMAPELRQEQILDSTRALMFREGYAGTTMQSIAREAGVTRPVVYEFYRDRTELLQDLLARETAKALAVAQSVFPVAQSGEALNETMAWTMAAFLEIVSRAPETWKLVLLPPDGAPPEIIATITAGRAAIQMQIQTNILQLPESSSPGFDAELLATTLVAGCEVAARLMLTEPQQFSSERLTDAIGWIGEHIRFEWAQ